MAKFLTTHGISYRIENIITNAKDKLVLVSPYFQLSKNFFERLRDADNRGLKTVIIFGKSDLNEKAKSDLIKLKNIQIYFSENLHAKCYFNENEMVLASMNMYEYSENNNREMGVYFNKENDLEIYDAAFNETKSIVQSAKKININEITINIKETSYKGYYDSYIEEDDDDDDDDEIGYCIRCKDEIDLDEDKPYCYKCYKIWAKYEDDEYEEKHCHSCGRKYKTSLSDPFCNKCD